MAESSSSSLAQWCACAVRPRENRLVESPNFGCSRPVWIGVGSWTELDSQLSFVFALLYWNIEWKAFLLTYCTAHRTEICTGSICSFCDCRIVKTWRGSVALLQFLVAWGKESCIIFTAICCSQIASPSKWIFAAVSRFLQPYDHMLLKIKCKVIWCSCPSIRFRENNCYIKLLWT
jgi:hypothetical protein